MFLVDVEELACEKCWELLVIIGRSSVLVIPLVFVGLDSSPGCLALEPWAMEIGKSDHLYFQLQLGDSVQII